MRDDERTAAWWTARWASLDLESREHLLGRTMALEGIVYMVSATFREMVPAPVREGIRNMDGYRQFSELVDGLRVDSLVHWDNETLAAFSQTLAEFEEEILGTGPAA